MAEPPPPPASASASASQRYLLRMNDGRQFTDYTPRGGRVFEGGMSSNDAKNRMIAQADQLIARDRAAAAAVVGAAYNDASPLAHVPGFEITQTCDTRSCTFAATPSADGIGTQTRSA